MSTPTAIPSPIATSILPGSGSGVDSSNCKLMGPFALFVQAIMGILVVGSLIYKRQRERPKRKWKIWLLDVTKQMLGQLFVHILNVVFSDAGAEQGGDNPCSLYFLNILIDTTLGVFFIYAALRFLTHFLTDVIGLPGFVSGQYDDQALPPRRGRSARPKLSYWFRQLGTYLLVLFGMKLSVLALLAIFPFLNDVAAAILSIFGNNKDAQVLFSMSLFPLTMNVLQFWLIDSVLRHNPNTSKYARVPQDSSATPALPGHFVDHDQQDTPPSPKSRSPSPSPPTPSHRLSASLDSLRIEAGRALSDDENRPRSPRRESHNLRSVTISSDNNTL